MHYSHSVSFVTAFKLVQITPKGCCKLESFYAQSAKQPFAVSSKSVHLSNLREMTGYIVKSKKTVSKQVSIRRKTLVMEQCTHRHFKMLVASKQKC